MILTSRSLSRGLSFDLLFSQDVNHIFSSIPMKNYDQDHCKRMQVMKMFRQKFGCRILPLYGTLDLDTNNTLPVCGREAMWSMMPMMRMRSGQMMREAEAMCPRDCWQEEILAQMSFTVMSEENFENALQVWQDFPAELTKEDVVSMEIFFESLTAQV